MRQHRYRITVEHVASARPGQAVHEPLCFETGNHDEILGIVDRLRTRSGLPESDAAALGIGLKLFSETLLIHRDAPLFAGLLIPMRQFIGRLKTHAKDAPAG
ncbi:MAG: DUF3861 domain-containing protein [Stenotrophobium sp.]